MEKFIEVCIVDETGGFGQGFVEMMKMKEFGRITPDMAAVQWADF